MSLPGVTNAHVCLRKGVVNLRHHMRLSLGDRLLDAGCESLAEDISREAGRADVLDLQRRSVEVRWAS